MKNPVIASRAVLVMVFLVVMNSGCTRHRNPPPAVSEVLMADEHHKDRILRGIYAGEGGWRWTAPTFAFALDPPPATPTYLELDFTVPQELMEKNTDVTVVSRINGVEAARQTYRKEGRYVLAGKVPAEALKRQPAEVEFSVDRSVNDPGTGRTLGVIVISVALKEYEQTAEFRDAQLAIA